MYDLDQFIEKYNLAVKTAQETNLAGGLCGFELEWNLLDSEFRPLLTIGTGPNQQSFVDFFRAEYLSPWANRLSQLEVFHWMIEWTTQPYYNPRGAVYESRLLEALLINALHQAGKSFGERLYYWPGNLLYLLTINHDSIPGSWHIAKRRYLERCVDLYGSSLATAGTHTNLSLPNPLLAWDFMHLPAIERGDSHLDVYKNQVYITATRLMRAFAALFIATTAATPLQAQVRDGKTCVVITDYDSVRNLTFPNPSLLDLPNLYRSYEDYLHLSYDLVRRGIRFGNNNWTPVRARSFADPVERLIAVTSEQLKEIYARGLYAVGETQTVDQLAQQIEIQNLLARINIPMARIEIRTDDNGHPMELDIANLTLKHLLLMKFYADPDFARSFRYDNEDLHRARRNEEIAARFGLHSEIENPFTNKVTSMRHFLSWSIAEVKPLAEALGFSSDLRLLEEMALGAPNTAEKLRVRLRNELGVIDEVPVDVLRMLAEERENQVKQDVEIIVEHYPALNSESRKLGEFIQHARDEVHVSPNVPIRFQPRPMAQLEFTYPDKTSEILTLTQQLIRIPSVTGSPNERLNEVHRAAKFIYDYLFNHGLEVRCFDKYKYPAILAGFPGSLYSPVMLNGHFDVVEPEPDDSQFDPLIRGDYLWGRGATDMKTVVATFLVWMKDTLRENSKYPPINLLLVGNEENGEGEPMGTPHVLRDMDADKQPEILIAGERTGEKGDELWGEICVQNRGLMRFNIIFRSQREHSGGKSPKADLTIQIFKASVDINNLVTHRLTLQSDDGWQSQVRFPFIQAGIPGIYNITADKGILGVEVRSIPQDDLQQLHQALCEYCETSGLEFETSVMENGVVCSMSNQYLLALLQASEKVSGQLPKLGKKLPATSARFAPHQQGVVWGQSGIGPHAADERHYIPSIFPYYQTLKEFSHLLIKDQGDNRSNLG